MADALMVANMVGFIALSRNMAVDQVLALVRDNTDHRPPDFSVTKV